MKVSKLCKIMTLASVLSFLALPGANADCPCDKDTPRYQSNEDGEYGGDQEGFRGEDRE